MIYGIKMFNNIDISKIYQINIKNQTKRKNLNFDYYMINFKLSKFKFIWVFWSGKSFFKQNSI